MQSALTDQAPDLSPQPKTHKPVGAPWQRPRQRNVVVASGRRLLRALGARRRDIVVRFLREAVVICVSGSGIGLAFGALLAYLIATFAEWQVAWSPLLILISVGLCALIGMAFAVYPARQAAALDPITAIRAE